MSATVVSFGGRCKGGGQMSAAEVRLRLTTGPKPIAEESIPSTIDHVGRVELGACTKFHGCCSRTDNRSLERCRVLFDTLLRSAELVVRPHRHARHKTPRIVTDAASSLHLSVCLSVCLSVGHEPKPY